MNKRRAAPQKFALHKSPWHTSFLHEKWVTKAVKSLCMPALSFALISCTGTDGGSSSDSSLATNSSKSSIESTLSSAAPQSELTSSVPPSSAFSSSEAIPPASSLMASASLIESSSSSVSVSSSEPIIPQGPSIIYALNSGGNEFQAADGTVYLADTPYASEGSTFNSTIDIDGTEDDALFQSERHGDFSYELPVTDGLYNVTLFFAEIFHDEAGKRSFDVWVEDKFAESNLDIVAETSGKGVALTRTHDDILVTDGKLTIRFEKHVNEAKISAIHITSLNGGITTVTGNQDTDSDGVLDSDDQCPSQAGSIQNQGCPELDADAVMLYGEQCESCHGDEKGQGVSFPIGGALTGFECDKCTNVAELAQYLEAEMPPNNPAACDLDCGTKLANYIFDHFDGYDNNLTGQQLYEGLCQDCHGDGVQTENLVGARLVPASCQTCGDKSTLISRIESTMPTVDPTRCDLLCSTKITDYIFGNFEGYNALEAEEDALNMAAPTGSARFNNGKVEFTWAASETAPDFWMLEHWNTEQATWELLAKLPSNATRYSHNAEQMGHYRLYTITRKIASFPAHFRPPAYTIRTKGRDVWAKADSYHFSHIEQSGDFKAEVRVESVGRANQWTKAGLMVRGSLDLDSINAFALLSPDNGGAFTVRDTTGENTKTNARKADIKAPATLRVERNGDKLTFQIKPDGGAWEDFAEETLSLPQQVYVGLAVTSHDVNREVTATFTNFHINDAAVTTAKGQSFDTTSDATFYPVPTNNSGKLTINPAVAPVGITHLSRFEYLNQLHDFFPEKAFELTLPTGDTKSGYEVGIDTSTLGVERYYDAAQTVGIAVAASDLDTLDCDTDANATCLATYINEITEKFFRRPAPDQLKAALTDLYKKVSDDSGKEKAIQAINEVLAQSPSFIYKFEANNYEAGANIVVPVTGYEMATRLASALWAGAPDAELLEKAKFGMLSTPAQIKEQATRMVKDPKARRGFRNFYHQWLNIEKLLKADRQIEGVTFDKNVAQEMIKGLDAYVEEIVFSDDDGTLDALLTSPMVGNNSTLATFTGIQSDSDDITVESTQGSAGGLRTGLLGQPAILAKLAHAKTTSIVERGVYINETFFCAGFQPPPDDAPELSSIDPTNKRAREILNELTADPKQCAFCHELINDVGSTLENFDAVGRYRTQDLGLSIDALGTVFARDADNNSAEINGLSELNTYLASLDNVKACFASEFLTYATQHIPSVEERSSVNWLVETLSEKDWNIQELLIEATQTPVFLYKKLP